MRIRSDTVVIASTLLILTLIVGTLFALTSSWKHGQSYIDRFTGSRKGITTWFWGLRTQESHTISALEQRLISIGSVDIRHDWQLRSGHGETLLGRITFRETGYAIKGLSHLFYSHSKEIADWLTTADDSQVLHLYSQLQNPDKEIAEAALESIHETMTAKEVEDGAK